MLSVIGLAAILWLAAWGLGMPIRLRWTLVGLVYFAVLLVHLVMPDGAQLRVSTGGSAAPWLLLGAGVVLVMLYREVLRRLQSRADARATAPDDQKDAPLFSETELNRYARHIVLRELGGPGQKALKEARVLVVGAGGLGSPVLLYLAAAGVGTIGVIDDDEVSASNLQRQVIHADPDIGEPKVHSAAAKMRALNPFIDVKPYARKLTSDMVDALFADYDLVLDGTDNFDTRYMVNAAAVRRGIPLISGALSQWEGQISVFDPGSDAPCYQCVFPEAPAPGIAPSCAEAGVVGPLPGVIGTMMAVEAVKVIARSGAALRGEMLIYDALYGESRKIALSRRVDCPVCGGLASDASV